MRKRILRTKKYFARVRCDLNRTIYVYGDSTALPRHPELNAENTWPFNLGRKQDSIFVRGFGGATTTELVALMYRDSPYFGFSEKREKGDTVIFAAGIVDAAPRPITYKLKIVTKVPYIGNKIWKIIARGLNKYRPTIQRFLYYKLVSFRRTSFNLNKIRKILKNPQIQIIVVGTPLPSRYVLARSPHLESNIKRLNKIKSEVCKKDNRMHFVSLDFWSDTFYISVEDGHHYSALGHLEISNRIKSQLNLSNS